MTGGEGSTEPTEPTEPISTWNAQPAGGAVAAVGGPSGLLVAAGVILLAIAGLAGLLSVLIVFAGSIMGQVKVIYSQSGLSPEQMEAALSIGRVVVFVVGGIGILLALAHLASGIGILRRRGWARILGLVLSSLGILLWALVLVGNLAAATQAIPAGYLSGTGLTMEEYRSLTRVGMVVGLAISGIAVAGYTFVLVVLIRRGSEFA